MSFHLNNAQQMAIHDSLLSLTEREMKHLMSSWAETFSKLWVYLIVSLLYRIWISLPFLPILVCICLSVYLYGVGFHFL